MIHKRIIGVAWIILGAIFISPVLLYFAQMPSMLAVAQTLAISLLFLVAGFMMFANYHYTSWVAAPCAALSLFTWPIGTIFGVYYLWYFFKFEFRRQSI